MLKHSVVTALNFRFDLTNAIELFSVSAWFTSTEIKQTALALSKCSKNLYLPRTFGKTARDRPRGTRGCEWVCVRASKILVATVTNLFCRSKRYFVAMHLCLHFVPDNETECDVQKYCCSVLILSHSFYCFYTFERGPFYRARSKRLCRIFYLNTE